MVLQVGWGLMGRPDRIPHLFVVIRSVGWTRSSTWVRERSGQAGEVERLGRMLLELTGRWRGLSESWAERLLSGRGGSSLRSESILA